MKSKLKVLSVFGTRPEAIKMAPVVAVLARHADRIDSRVCVTGQHRQMLDQVLRLFQITPEHDLSVMQSGQTLIQVATAVMTGLEPILTSVQPDWLLVQGDTTTVMAAAIAGFYKGIKIGHVEAGLRSFDKWKPYPEEINRKIAGATADLHFAPTQRSRSNLLREGVAEANIVVTGNTVIDALHWVLNREPTPEVAQLHSELDIQRPGRRIILVTAHRRENFGAPFERICRAIQRVAEHYGDRVLIVYPVHLNPNVQTPARSILGALPNVRLLPPLDYLPLVHLMKHAHLVLTDSGGIQEEAPGLGKPVLVLRDTTERPEAVEAGTVRLVGSDEDAIVTWTKRILDDAVAYGAMARAVNPYGDGQASERIVEALLRA